MSQGTLQKNTLLQLNHTHSPNRAVSYQSSLKHFYTRKRSRLHRVTDRYTNCFRRKEYKLQQTTLHCERMPKMFNTSYLVLKAILLNMKEMYVDF